MDIHRIALRGAEIATGSILGSCYYTGQWLFFWLTSQLSWWWLLFCIYFVNGLGSLLLLLLLTFDIARKLRGSKQRSPLVSGTFLLWIIFSLWYWWY